MLIFLWGSGTLNKVKASFIRTAWRSSTAITSKYMFLCSFVHCQNLCVVDKTSHRRERLFQSEKNLMKDFDTHIKFNALPGCTDFSKIEEFTTTRKPTHAVIKS